MAYRDLQKSHGRRKFSRISSSGPWLVFFLAYPLISSPLSMFLCTAWPLLKMWQSAGFACTLPRNNKSNNKNHLLISREPHSMNSFGPIISVLPWSRGAWSRHQSFLEARPFANHWAPNPPSPVLAAEGDAVYAKPPRQDNSVKILLWLLYQRVCWLNLAWREAKVGWCLVSVHFLSASLSPSSPRLDLMTVQDYSWKEWFPASNLTLSTLITLFIVLYL